VVLEGQGVRKIISASAPEEALVKEFCV